MAAVGRSTGHGTTAKGCAEQACADNNTMDNIESRDADWLNRMGRGRCAKVLRDHLACIEDRFESHGREGSIKEAGCNRETFLSALHQSCTNGTPFPCGLPDPLPRYIAIVNLSGQRMMVTSQSDTLMRKLCARSWQTHPDILKTQLLDFSNYIERRNAGLAQGSIVPGMETRPPSSGTAEFVLITYSLPWQSGIETAFWELNTVCIMKTKNGNRVVHDRSHSLTSLSNTIFAARPTLSSAGGGFAGISMAVGMAMQHTLRFVSDDQIRAFGNSYWSVDLDSSKSGPEQDDYKNTQASTATEIQLRSIIDDLKRQRDISGDEASLIRKELDTLKEKHEAAIRAQEEEVLAAQTSADGNARDAIEANRQELERLRTSNAQLMTDQSNADQQVAEITKRMDKMRKQETSKDKLHNAAAAKQAAEIKRLSDRLEAQSRAAAEQLAETKKTHSHAYEQLEATSERQKSTLQETLSWKEKVCNQLVENNDSKLTELEETRTSLLKARGDIDALTIVEKTLRSELWTAEVEAETSTSRPVVVAQSSTRDVHCSTSSCGTSTHHHNGTQTGNGCIMAEDLPGEFHAALPKPPSWATASPVSPSTPITSSPIITPIATPVATPMPSSTPMPAGMSPEGSYQPFGTPQMAMNAAMSSIGHLLSWTQFLESEAIQRHAPAHLNQYAVYRQHLVTPQPMPQPMPQPTPQPTPPPVPNPPSNPTLPSQPKILTRRSRR